MGTNYYFKSTDQTLVQIEGLHLGKASAGWCFKMRVYPELGIHGINDWRKLWPNGVIVDEFGRITSSCEIESQIAFPHAVGRGGLMRDEIDGRHCVGHGPGPCDYCIGDFS